MQTSPKPSFVNRHTADILVVSLGAFAIVVFLSVAFVWFDATNLPASNSTIGVTNRSEENQGVIKKEKSNPFEHKQQESDQRDTSEDLVAIAEPILTKAPFQFASEPSASLLTTNLNAVISSDNMTWRYTKDGWNDISMAVKPSQTHESILERIHPVIWTVMLLLAALLLLIMASSDADIRKLVGLKTTRK